VAAKAICNVCKKEQEIETTPLGLAMMPREWFVTVRDNEGDLKIVDVCSDVCAQAFDKSVGRTETILDTLDASGEPVTQTIEHKADN
jgi:hypothetical protein